VVYLFADCHFRELQYPHHH